MELKRLGLPIVCLLVLCGIGLAVLQAWHEGQERDREVGLQGDLESFSRAASAYLIEGARGETKLLSLVRSQELTPLLRLRAGLALVTAARQDGPQLREALFARCAPSVLRECLAPLEKLFASLDFLEEDGGRDAGVASPAKARIGEGAPKPALESDPRKPVIDVLLDRVVKTKAEIDVEPPDAEGCRRLILPPPAGRSAAGHE